MIIQVLVRESVTVIRLEKTFESRPLNGLNLAENPRELKIPEADL
jgi:hypothetical protein